MEIKKSKPILDRTIDFIFSKDERKWLLLIFLLGLILRFIITSHNAPVADEMVHGSHALGISSLRPLSTITQGPIWFYLTDIAYRIFNVHLFSGRFLALLFGSLSILLIYLLAGLFFNKKTALISSFLFAVSPFHMLWARIYMDEFMAFFILLAAYLFIKDYKTKGYITPLSALFLGIGCLIKIIAGVFIVVFSLFLIFSVYKNRSNKELFKKSLKYAIFFFIIIALCLVPLVSYNYFLYKEKGIVDLPFAMYFGINTQVYQGSGLAHEGGFMINNLPRNLYIVFTVYFLKQDAVNLILGVLGLLLFVANIRKEETFEKSFILVLFGFALLFIASTIVLDTHYTYFVAIFAILGGQTIDYISKKVSEKNERKIISLILLAVLIFNLIFLWNVILTKSSTEKVREFAIDNIDKDSLVVADSRIYRGNIAWMLNDKHYVEASLLPQLMEYSKGAEGRAQLVHTYFIECAIDDCGWGTIKDQPDFNKSMEDMAAAFKNISQKTFQIKGGGTRVHNGYDDSRLNQFIIYETYIPINPVILQLTDQTHNFFFYDIPRNRNPIRAFDYYEVYGVLDTILNFIAYSILYLLIALAVISMVYVFYLVYLSDGYEASSHVKSAI